MSEAIRNVMTRNPTCCTPDMSLQQVAKMMVDHDCGCIPVVDKETKTPVGTITDRDITCRTIAQGKDPMTLTVQDAMTANCITVKEDAKLDDAVRLMEKHKIRRVLVVDAWDKCCGIVAQADIARTADKKKTGEVVQEVSRE